MFGEFALRLPALFMHRARRDRMERAMKRSLFALSAIVLTLACTQASSQTLTLTGYGAETCEKWLTSQRTPDAPGTIALDNWVFGHLDGVAKFVDATYVLKGKPAPDMLQGLDRQSVVALMGEYCRTNPALTVDSALNALSAQMVAGDRQIVKSDLRR